MPLWARQKRAEERPREIIAPSRVLETAEGVATAPSSDAATALERGRIIHKLLEHLPGLAVEAREAAARRYLALPVHGLEESAQVEMAEAALLLLADPGIAPLFAEGLAEAPIAGEIVLGGRMMKVGGTIDRLLITKTRIVILDFKTNRLAPMVEAEVSEGYVAQMALYRELVKALYPGRAVDCALLYTAGPRAIFLGEAAMAACLSRAFPPLEAPKRLS